MWTKYFYYFQGLRALKCHRTKRSNRVNYRSKWLLQKTFLSSTPPPAWISRVFDPPSSENFQNPIRRAGVDFFWNNPLLKTPDSSNQKLFSLDLLWSDFNLRPLELLIFQTKFSFLNDFKKSLFHCTSTHQRSQKQPAGILSIKGWLLQEHSFGFALVSG